jgi:CBS domain containing-hemolysin-like protein
MILKPFVGIGVWVMGLLTGGRGWKPQKMGSIENLHREISQSAAQMRPAEKQMIDQVLGFRKVVVSQVMTPLSQVVSITPTATMEDLLALAKKTDFERFPVITANGEVLGLIQLTDFLSNGTVEGSLLARMRRIVSVSERETGFSVLQKLRAARLTLALVTGAEGKPVGIIASEDLIRHLLTGKAA